MQTFSRIVLPILLFVVVIFGVSYIANYTPRVRDSGSEVVEMPVSPLFLPTTTAQSSTLADFPSFKFYRPEVEVGREGQFDFWFKNFNDREVSLELEQTNCNCSSIEIGVVTDDGWGQYVDRVREAGSAAALAGMIEPLALTPLAAGPLALMVDPGRDAMTWTTLMAAAGETAATDGDRKARVAAADPTLGARLGVVRLKWNRTKSVGSNMLFARLYAALPEQARRKFDFAVEVIGVPGIAAVPSKLDFGTISQGQSQSRELVCFSPTRGAGTLRPVVELTDPEPCIVLGTPKELTADEIRALRNQYPKEFEGDIGVASAYRVPVVIHSDTGRSSMDLGPFRRTVVIRSANSTLDPEGDRATVVLEGMVRGDVRVTAAGSQRHEVNFGGNFPSTRARTAEAKLVSDHPGISLKLIDGGIVPSFLKAELVDVAETDTRREWVLRVDLPARRLYGKFPDASAVLLEVTRPDGQTRKLRVPIRGESYDGGDSPF